MPCFGIACLRVAIEQDPAAVERTSQSFPNVISMQFVEDFRGEVLTDFLRRRTVKGVIIGGGSPCQGNSALNPHRRGLDDVRSHQPSQLVRIAEEVAELQEARGLRILTFFWRMWVGRTGMWSSTTTTSCRPSHSESKRRSSDGCSATGCTG